MLSTHLLANIKLTAIMVGRWKSATSIISFYVSPKHKDIREVLADEFAVLRNRKINYVVFQDSDMPIPSMCCDGMFVSGYNEIKQELNAVLNR